MNKNRGTLSGSAVAPIWRGFNRALKVLPLVGALGFGASCSANQRGWPPPVFPAGNPTTVLTIVYTLHPGAVLAEARLRGVGGRESSALAIMDSGSSEAVMPYEVASELGLRGIVQTRVDAAGNRPVRATVVEIPELVLGDLVVRKVLAAAMPSSIMTIVGQSILRHAPWAISWDRGTLTLGAAPWPMAGDVVAVPLHRTPRNPGDEIEVRINGHLVRMLLDTGAAESALPADVAAPLGLSPGTSSRAVLDLGGVARLAHSYWGALQIGPISIEHQRFNELPRGKTALLGLDVLSRFELLVVPGQRLLLRQRRDPRATAAERIRRWAWLPSCASPACVRARLEPWGRNGNGQLQLDIEAELPRPVHLYVGCASGEAVRGLLFVDLVVVKPGQMTADIWLGGSNWFSPQGLRCRDLKVLDVIPAPDLRSGSPWIHARLEEEP